MTLKDLLERHGIEIDENKEKLLSDYLEFLSSAPLNLTSFRREELPVKAVLDTLFPLKDLPIHTAFMDVGTGGGIPGIIVSIYFDVEGVLLDSTRKKLLVLEKFISEKQLPLRTIWGRAEEVAHNGKERGKYEFVLTRALAKIRVALELTAPFAMVGGYVVMYKGPKWKEELEESWETMEVLGLDLGDVLEYTLPTGEKRALVIFEKIKTTPKKYPRKFSQIAKRPPR